MDTGTEEYVLQKKRDQKVSMGPCWGRGYSSLTTEEQASCLVVAGHTL